MKWDSLGMSTVAIVEARLPGNEIRQSGSEVGQPGNLARQPGTPGEQWQISLGMKLRGCHGVLCLTAELVNVTICVNLYTLKSLSSPSLFWTE